MYLAFVVFFLLTEVVSFVSPLISGVGNRILARRNLLHDDLSRQILRPETTALYAVKKKKSIPAGPEFSRVLNVAQVRSSRNRC